MYLRVRNFEKYQNADIFKKSKGRPPWVKLHRDMLEDEQLLALPYEAQLLFDRLLLVAASQRNAFSSDSEWIAGRTRMDSQTIAKCVPMLVKGRWLSQTKTPRLSRKILEPREKNSPPRREEKKNAPKERSSSSYRSKEATPATASANGAAAGSPSRKDTKPEHQPLNVPHTPAGAEAYVRNVGWHDDPDLVSTLRRTYSVRDADELERLLSLADDLAAS